MCRSRDIVDTDDTHTSASSRSSHNSMPDLLPRTVADDDSSFDSLESPGEWPSDDTMPSLLPRTIADYDDDSLLGSLERPNEWPSNDKPSVTNKFSAFGLHHDSGPPGLVPRIHPVEDYVDDGDSVAEDVMPFSYRWNGGTNTKHLKIFWQTFSPSLAKIRTGFGTNSRVKITPELWPLLLHRSKRVFQCRSYVPRKFAAIHQLLADGREEFLLLLMDRNRKQVRS